MAFIKFLIVWLGVIVLPFGAYGMRLPRMTRFIDRGEQRVSFVEKVTDVQVMRDTVHRRSISIAQPMAIPSHATKRQVIELTTSGEEVLRLEEASSGILDAVLSETPEGTPLLDAILASPVHVDDRVSLASANTQTPIEPFVFAADASLLDTVLAQGDLTSIADYFLALFHAFRLSEPLKLSIKRDAHPEQKFRLEFHAPLSETSARVLGATFAQQNVLMAEIARLLAQQPDVAGLEVTASQDQDGITTVKTSTFEIKETRTTERVVSTDMPQPSPGVYRGNSYGVPCAAPAYCNQIWGYSWCSGR